MNKLCLSVLIFAVLALLLGCNKPTQVTREPLVRSAQPAQQEAPATASAGDEAMPAAEASVPAAEAPETAAAAEEEEPSPEQAPAEGGEESAGTAGDASSDDSAAAAGEESEPAEPAVEPAGEQEEPAAGEGVVEEKTEDEANASDDTSVAEEAEPAAEDAETAELEAEPTTPIDQFKALDPREIIDRKYEDLQEQHTEPWDEEDTEQFIPDTGRVDPLTRVREAVPDELKPPRAGETDQNDIESYFIAQDATMICYAIAYAMECYNVIQIGIDKQTTLSVFGNTFLMAEGDSAGPINVGVSNGIPLSATLTCTSISESEVHVTVTVSGDGTSTSISKSMVFIPKGWM